jgi:hypothetical protein
MLACVAEVGRCAEVPRQPKAQPDLLMAGWAILHHCVQRLAEGVKEIRIPIRNRHK